LAIDFPPILYGPHFTVPFYPSNHPVISHRPMSNVQHLPPALADDKWSTTEESAAPGIPGDKIVAHPEIDCSSIGTICRSSWKRFTSIWTKRFVLSLIAGQIVSLCITCTSVATEELISRNWALPTTQTLFLCPLFPKSITYFSKVCA